jgi:tetratricopeptide (TPR) repeat protein
MEQVVQLRGAGANSKALKAVKAVLARSPNNARALVQMGAIYQDMQNWEQAGACYGKALLADPHNRAAQRNFEYLVARREMNRTRGERKILKDILVSEAIKAAKAGKYGKSKELFRLFRGVFPNDRSWMFYQAMIAELEGDSDRAIKLYSGLLRLIPDYAPARVNLILALLEKGALKSADVQAQKARELSPYNPKIRALVGILDDMKGAGARVMASGDPKNPNTRQ